MDRLRCCRVGDSTRSVKNSSSTSFSLVASISFLIGNPIMRATWPAQILPKFPDGTANDTCSVVRPGGGKIAFEIINDLRRDARPVYRVDRPMWYFA